MINKLLVIWPMHILGALFLVLLYIYLGLLMIFSSRKDELTASETVVKKSNMPVMRPLPIPTKSHNGLNQLLAFIFLVRKWRIEQTFSFKFQGKEYVIPKGFEFDGASIPRPLWALLSPTGLLLIPGLIHDFGYRYNGIYVKRANGNVELEHVGESQQFWDKLFSDLGDEINGIPLLNGIAMLGLALGGKSTWQAWRDVGLTPPPFNEAAKDHTEDVSEQLAKHDGVSENKPPKKENKSAQVKTKTTAKAPEKTEPLQGGKTKTTAIGYINKNEQRVDGSNGQIDSETEQLIYQLTCNHCQQTYHSLVKEIQHRKCPSCQSGKASVV